MNITLKDLEPTPIEFTPIPFHELVASLETTNSFDPDGADSKTDASQGSAEQSPPVSDTPDPDAEDQPIPFPLDALNGIQRRAVTAIATAFRQDPVLAGTGALVAFAGALGRLFRVAAASSLLTYPNIYAMVAAVRGYGKGASSRSMAPVITRDQFIKAEYVRNDIPRLKTQIMIEKARIKELLGKKEALDEAAHQNQLMRAQQSIELMEKQLANPPALIIGSSTGAALSGSMERNQGQLLSYSAEVGDSIKVALGRYTSDGGGDFDLLLSGYSVEFSSETRVSRGTINNDRPCMNIFWMPQHKLMYELLGNEEARERGLLARFLFASIERTDIPEDDGQTPPISQEDLQPWDDLINKVLDYRLSDPNRETVELQAEPEAKEIFRVFNNEMIALSNGEYRDISEELQRAKENAIRLALGQCLADAFEANLTPTILTADHARRGVALARYYYGQSMRLLRPAQEAVRQKAFKRLVLICTSKGGTITLRDLKNSHLISEEEVRRIVKHYPQQLKIETVPSSARGGRPSIILKLISYHRGF